MVAPWTIEHRKNRWSALRGGSIFIVRNASHVGRPRDFRAVEVKKRHHCIHPIKLAALLRVLISKCHGELNTAVMVAPLGVLEAQLETTALEKITSEWAL